MEYWVVTTACKDDVAKRYRANCSTRLDAMLTVANLKNLRANRITDADHMTGIAEKDGQIHHWSIDRVKAA